jgi:uroporphyrinogen-III synthase
VNVHGHDRRGSHAKRPGGAGDQQQCGAALGLHPARGRLSGLPLLAVGDQTALEAKRAGFRLARSAGGALADLAAWCAAISIRSADHCLSCGDALAGDLTGLLESAGFRVDSVVIYRSETRTHLTEAAAEALRNGSVDGVLFYSPRSAAAFAAACRPTILRRFPPASRVSAFPRR